MDDSKEKTENKEKIEKAEKIEKTGKRAAPNKKKPIISAVLLAAALILSVAARKAEGFAQWYSTHLYSLWVGSIGRILGVLPFSVSEMLLYLLLLGVLLWSVTAAAGRWKKVHMQDSKATAKAGGRQFLNNKGSGWNILLLAAVLCFLYVVNCGINYHRESFSESSGIEAREYTVEELEEVCRWLTQKVADFSGEVERGKDGGMVLTVPLGDTARKAMEMLGQDYPELAGYYPQPKKLLNSWILSIQNLSGVYSPFTIEANYNGDMQEYNIPFTACHELSHLRGFMQEQEANFIAFLACSNSDEEAFAYSGYLMGWIQCMNVLYRTDYEVWEEVRGQLPAEVEPDLKLNREFWARYDGRIAEVSNRVNDTYLKANGQADGVKSYNRMVDLIVAYYQMM